MSPRAPNNRLPVAVAWGGRGVWWGSGRRRAAAGALVRRVLDRRPHLLRVQGVQRSRVTSMPRHVCEWKLKLKRRTLCRREAASLMA